MSRTRTTRRDGFVLVATLVTWLATVATPAAAATLTWTETPIDLAAGRADGMAVSSRGQLFLAPRLRRVGGFAGAIEPAQIWVMAADPGGNLYLGTGPEGHVLRIDAEGRSHVFFDADEPLVTALAFARDGAVLAATAPGGKVYRVAPGGTGQVWCETEERYVWSLAVARDGRVFAGTGERGRILELSPSGTASVVFDADEPHVTSLLTRPNGELLAGGSGRGLVYHVDRDGHAIVLHDDDLPQVVALAAGADGSVVAALVAPPEAEVRRPALQLRLPDGAPVGSAAETIAPLEPGSGPTLHGVIEGLPAVGQAPRPRERRGRVVRIDGDGAHEIWGSSDEAPFCLLTDPDGRVLFGTGEPARLYRVEGPEEVARLATLPEAQATALVALGQQVFLATSNPATTYLVDDGARDSGEFVSRPFDAGGPARWGSIRWRVDDPGGRTEVFTRTGNGREPDSTWSAWSPVLSDPSTSTVVNPEGRYLQWQVRQVGGSPSGPRISEVTVSYEPFNRAPRLRDLRADPAREAVAGEVSVRFEALDPDGDDLDVTLEGRPVGQATWSTAAETIAPGPAAANDPWREGRLVWDMSGLPEGEYELRVVASDQRQHAEGEGRRATLEGPTLSVDRTGPRIDVVAPGDGSIELRVTDERSRLVAVSILEGGEVRHTLRPLDGLCDSPREIFTVRLPAGADPAVWSVRGEDAAGNRTEQSLSGGRRSS